MMNAGSYLTHLLKQYDVDCVFGIPGVHTLELYRSLGDADLNHITPRHEQAAGFMADGYARATGKPGVCFIISGPGMTNIVTAMGQAFSESIPMLVISTVNAHGRMGSGEGWLHELPNQQSLISGVCEFSHTVHSAKEIPQVLARAFAVFDSCRPRPVHIEIPINVLQEAAPEAELPSLVTRIQPATGNSDAIQRAAELINNAHNPIILVGGGAARSHASITALAEAMDAPVVMTVNARGVVPSEHALAVPASASLPAVRDLVDASDVVLAVGTEMGPTDYDFNEDGQFKILGQLIQIDIDAQQLMRSHIPKVGIVGDANQTAASLLPLISRQVSSHKGLSRASSCINGVTSVTSERDTRYLELLTLINTHLNDPIIVGDSTQIIYAANSYYGSSKPNSYFNSAMGFGTLGYALPAAIGAAIGDPDRCVVAIMGDGGLQFCLSELATAVDANVRIVLIVHENGGYKEIKQFMSASKITPIGVDLMVPDIQGIGIACGWTMESLSQFSDIPDVLERTKQTECPALVLLQDDIFS